MGIYICIITPGWRLMRAVYHTCFHTLYDEKNVYIVWVVEFYGISTFVGFFNANSIFMQIVSSVFNNLV